MGILDEAQRRKAQAEKAQAFDQLQTQQAAKQVARQGYAAGEDNAYRAIEQQLAVREEAQRRQQINDIARRYGLDEGSAAMINSLTNKPDSYPLSLDDVLGVAGAYRNPEEVASEYEAIRAKGHGPLSLDDLGFMARRPQQGQVPQDITPAPAGLANTLTEGY